MINFALQQHLPLYMKYSNKIEEKCTSVKSKGAGTHLLPIKVDDYIVLFN